MIRFRSLLLQHFFAVLLVLLFTMSIQAKQITQDINYSIPEVKKNGTNDQVFVPNALNMDDPGNPALPADGIWVVLPPGEKASSVEVFDIEWKTIPGEYKIAPAEYPFPLSQGQLDPVVPNATVYGADEFYPQNPVRGLNTHIKRGVSTATFLLQPVRWNPATGQLQYMATATIRVETVPGERETESFDRFYKGEKAVIDWIENRVINPEGAFLYPRRDDGEMEKMLIVTVDDLMDPAIEYAAWRSVRGIECTIATVEDLSDNQDGVDQQEQLRNGIREFYEDNDINYLLLIGDVAQIPHRGLSSTVNGELELDIPGDIYYSAMDGRWNDDDDEEWGELNEADFVPEFSVGRIPAETRQQANAHLHKIYQYSDEPVIDDVMNVLMVGENLGWQHMGGEFMNEVYEGSANYNFRTTGFTEDFVRTNLYDMDREWNPVNDLMPLLAGGQHFVHHLGHSNTRYTMKINWDNFNRNLFTNDGVENGYNILWTQGCYGGSFDNRTTDVNQYIDDCISEEMVAKTPNGFVAIISNSRYGWGSGNSTDGSSQHYHREYVDAMMAEDFTIIGKANDDSKEDTVPWTEFGVFRWCHYEINIFGDPAMDQWTAEPVEIAGEYPPAITIGDEEYVVELEDAPNAYVTLSREGEVIVSGMTDEEGMAALPIEEPILPPGPVDLTIIAHNHLPLHDQVTSVADSLGFPWVVELNLWDAEGTMDGLADAGETITLQPSVRNYGGAVIEGLEITLNIEDEFIESVVASSIFEPIEEDEDAVPEDALVLNISPECPDMHVVSVEFNLEDDNGESWTQELPLTIHAPNLCNASITVLDADGNDNNRLDPGEEAMLQLHLENTGSGIATDLNVEMISGSQWLSVIESQSSLEWIEGGDAANFEPTLMVNIDEECPSPTRGFIYLRIAGAFDYSFETIVGVKIGGVFECFDRNNEIWEHAPVIDEHNDQWHYCDNDNYTVNGVGCLKVGGEEVDALYDPMLNCAIYLPPFEVPGDVRLQFMHKMQAEDSEAHEGYAYDGGVVEGSIDGETWEPLEPHRIDGIGYTHLTRIGGAESPWEEEYPIFSGEFDWQPVFFELGEFEDEELQIRFRFGSDNGVHMRGWSIDDVEIYAPIGLQAPDNLAGELISNQVHLEWDTPTLHRDDGELLGYHVYRGGMVEWEVLEPMVLFPSFVDDLISMEEGEYMYMVSAVYASGESQPSNFIFIDYEYNDVANRNEQAIPQKWEISSVYPNPFNAVSQIRYGVPKAGDVKISVFDNLGRQAAVLVDQNMHAGWHTATFNAQSLATGIYIIRMDTPQGFHSAKILLIK